MDETDLEKFDKFVEKHWGNSGKQQVTVGVAEETKKRTRKTKTEN